MIHPFRRDPFAALTPQERERLQCFRWAWELHADGFSWREARRLVFARYLFERGRLSE